MLIFQFLLLYVYFVNCLPEAEEVNNQFETTLQSETSEKPTEHAVTDISTPDVTEHENQTQVQNMANNSDIREKSIQIITNIESTSFITKLFVAITKPIMEFVEEPKVNNILKNIGTCVVNGVMEIVSYYFPAPLIPLIASAAGIMIPFEPVVTLRKRMPVTSYRRAFNKALNSFMGTFDRFKTSEEDPYMTQRFNRRFMQHNSLQDKDN